MECGTVPIRETLNSYWNKNRDIVQQLRFLLYFDEKKQGYNGLKFIPEIGMLRPDETVFSRNGKCSSQTENFGPGEKGEVLCRIWNQR
jgi:hypothetical protein